MKIISNIKRWLKKEWAIFCYSESVEGHCAPKHEYDKKIVEIKKKYHLTNNT